MFALIAIYASVAVVLIFVVLGIVVAKKPSDFCIKRSLLMDAPAAVIFSQVNDLRRWEAWSPWAKLDPQMKRTYEGKESGIGASSTWVGNNQVGEGRSTITDSRPHESIQLMLQFFKPFKAVNEVDFTFESRGNQTFVTWSMSGKNKGMAKLMALLINCDTMVGAQFEKGLADLKTVAEGKK